MSTKKETWIGIFSNNRYFTHIFPNKENYYTALGFKTLLPIDTETLNPTISILDSKGEVDYDRPISYNYDKIDHIHHNPITNKGIVFASKNLDENLSKENFIFFTSGSGFINKTIKRIDCAIVYDSYTVDLDGNFIGIGREFATVSKNKPIITKFNSVGKVLWHKHLNSDSRIVLNRVIADNECKYIAIGSDSNMVPVIIKFNTYGDILWSKQIGPLRKRVKLTRIIQSDRGTFTITASLSTNSIIVDEETLIFKIDSSGKVLWCKQIDTPQLITNAIATDNFGNYVLVGFKRQTLFGSKAFIISLDKHGNFHYGKILYSKDSMTNLNDVMIDKHDNYIAVGVLNSNNLSTSEALFIKLNQDDFVKQKTIPVSQTLSLENVSFNTIDIELSITQIETFSTDSEPKDNQPKEKDINKTTYTRYDV